MTNRKNEKSKSPPSIFVLIVQGQRRDLEGKKKEQAASKIWLLRDGRRHARKDAGEGGGRR